MCRNVALNRYRLCNNECFLNRNHGYADDISTYGMISGLWTSMTALGFFVGPSVGGFLLETVGFRNGSTFILAGQAILVSN